MSKLLVTLLLTFPSFASAAQHQAVAVQPEPLTVAVDRIGHDFIRFQVCTKAGCQPLTGETGIYRLSDLATREDELVNGSEDVRAWRAKVRRRLNVLAGLGCALCAAAHGTLMYLSAQGILNMPAFYALTAADAVGLTPVVMAFWYPFLLVPSEDRVSGALGEGLRRAVGEDFDVATDAAFRDHVSRVKRALHGLETVSLCEAGLR